MILIQMYRKSLQIYSEEKKVTREEHVYRIVRCIYTGVLNAATRKKSAYSYCIPYGSFRLTQQERNELGADVIYELQILFPDSNVLHKRSVSRDIICIDWV